MILNLADPVSILAWWKVLPERHGPQLQVFAQLRPQFAAAIRTALRQIKSDPELRLLFEQGLAADNNNVGEARQWHYKDDPAEALLAA